MRCRFRACSLSLRLRRLVGIASLLLPRIRLLCLPVLHPSDASHHLPSAQNTTFLFTALHHLLILHALFTAFLLYCTGMVGGRVIHLPSVNDGRRNMAGGDSW
jgi:hypothetical protein